MTLNFILAEITKTINKQQLPQKIQL